MDLYVLGGKMKKRFVTMVTLFVVTLCLFAFKFSNNVYAETRQETNKLTLLNVVKTWTSVDDEECTWERHVPIKKAPGYEVYEAAIWDNSVRLYKFDKNFDAFKLNRDYREKFLVAKYDIPGGRDSEDASKYIAQAFKDIFRIMVENSPAKYYGIKMTGHGSGPGYMFSNEISPEDTQDLMKYITNLLGRKIDFYDMSTNCQQGTVEMMNEFYPYFNYILASELNAGGYSNDYGKDENFLDTFDFQQYPTIFSQNKSLELILKDLVSLKRRDWENCINNMSSRRTKQSLSLLDMNKYEPFMQALKQGIKRNNININDINGLQDLVYTIPDSHLSDMYNSFVVYRQSNEDFFRWDKNYGALSFNSIDSILNFDEKFKDTKTETYPQTNEDANSGEETQPDRTDNSPRSWELESVLIESDHNYSNNSYDLKSYYKSNSEYVALYFTKIDTEKDVDYIYILDKNKKLVEKFSGDIPRLTVVVPGDKAYVYLVSNNVNTYYGYKVEYAAFY